MKFRIIATILLLAALGISFLLFSGPTTNTKSTSSPAQTNQSAPAKKSPFVTN